MKDVNKCLHTEGRMGKKHPFHTLPPPQPPRHAHENNKNESKAKGSRRHASIIKWRPRRLVLGRRRGDGLGSISPPRIHGPVVAPAAHHVHFSIHRAHGHHDVAGGRLRFPGTLFRRGSGSHGEERNGCCVWHKYAMISFLTALDSSMVGIRTSHEGSEV